MLDRVSEPGASIREDDRIVLLCGMWSLWNTRNDYHHGKKPINPALAIDWATDACYHLLIVQQNTRRGPTTRADNWQPPPEGVVKLNCHIRQLRSLLRHSGRCGDTVGTCDAVQDVLGTAPANILPQPI